MVSNSASVTFLKICYYGRQWDLIWCNDTSSHCQGRHFILEQENVSTCVLYWFVIEADSRDWRFYKLQAFITIELKYIYID